MLTGHWYFGIFSCKLLFSIENINKLLSVMVSFKFLFFNIFILKILAYMSFERFIVVCRPFEFLSINFVNRKRRMFISSILLTILLITIGIFCFPIIYYANVTYQIHIFPNGNLKQGNTLCKTHLPERLMVFFIFFLFKFINFFR
jgi:hypothetical protein